MSDLKDRHCRPYEGSAEGKLSPARVQELIGQVQGWSVDADGAGIRREFKFPDFYRTMNFINAVAWIANAEDHHPDVELGYNYARVRFSTHSVDGLSENDFICAAKIDALVG